MELAVFNVARRCRRERKKMNKRICKKDDWGLVTLKQKRLARLCSSKLHWVCLAMTYEESISCLNFVQSVIPIIRASKNDINDNDTKQSVQV